MRIEETRYDVIVIGSGGAGLKAALASIDKGARTLILTKGEPQRSGGTLSAHYSFCAAPPHSAVGDSTEQFAQDIIRSSEGISDPKLVDILTARAYEAIEYAAQLGVRFDRAEDGSDYDLGWLAGHTHARAFHVGNVVGRELTRVLLRRLNKLQAEIHAFTQVLQLHIVNGQYKGVFAYHYPTGEIIYYSSRSVVIATGGGAQVYELNTNPTEATGDGYSLAMMAGIELLDMEFVQFYPTVLVAPKGTRGLMFNSGIVIPRGARLKNAHGEDFWDRYQSGELKQATRDMMSRIMAAEIGAGNATDNGGLIVDAAMVDDKDIPQLQQQLLTDLGLDASSKKYEAAPGAHYFMGGIRIDEHAAATLPGVFAAGECSGGIHGANRLAGNALSENQVFGAIAGEQAAHYAMDARHVEADYSPSADLDSESLEWYKRQWNFLIQPSTGQEPQVTAIHLIEQLRSVMQRNVGVNRDEEGLARAKIELQAIEDKLRHKLTIQHATKGYNRERIKTIDLFHMLNTSKMIVYGAMERRESRGAHNRLDYPNKQESFKASIALRMSNDRLSHIEITR